MTQSIIHAFFLFYVTKSAEMFKILINRIIKWNEIWSSFTYLNWIGIDDWCVLPSSNSVARIKCKTQTSTHHFGMLVAFLSVFCREEQKSGETESNAETPIAFHFEWQQWNVNTRWLTSWKAIRWITLSMNCFDNRVEPKCVLDLQQ